MKAETSPPSLLAQDPAAAPRPAVQTGAATTDGGLTAAMPGACGTACAPADGCGPGQACRHLRTKRMFIPAQADGALDVESERNDRAFYWCNITLSEMGCDDDRVHTRLCLSHRSCYQEA
ncbi:hypothetical protein DB346_14785 [Verrucomicrobia bacterium LW23]|nr:hypothetical protein DB346_14785 [Verrucomicrobia bacterium LW23]